TAMMQRLSDLLSQQQPGTLATLAATTAAAAGTLWLVRAWSTSGSRQKPPLPPGPRGWPLLGSLPNMDPKRSHESVLELCKTFGPIISYRLGSQLFIVINDYDLAKELLDDENFTGRSRSVVIQRQTGGCGLLFSEGLLWKQHRRLALKTLRDFGFAKDRSVEMVNIQLDDILTDLRDASESARPLNILDTFTEATNAVIATLTLGRQFRRGDPELEFVRTAARRLFAGRPLQNLPFLFPWTDYIVRLFPTSNEQNLVNMEILEFIQRQVQERLKLMGADIEGFEPECLCDVYIKERQKAEAAGDFESFKDMQVLRVVMELFMAGTDTTARSLEWLLLYMAFEQDWQSRVQAELDRVIDGERRPSMRDRDQLPLTCAVIEETYRIVSLTPFALFHRATQEDTVFHGYSFPTNALIFPFTYGMSRDPKVWARPNEFHPEHFLRPDGSFAGSGKNIPFSMGRRVCVGESLGRMEVFLIFSAVMKLFKVCMADEYLSKREDILRAVWAFLATGQVWRRARFWAFQFPATTGCLRPARWRRSSLGEPT
uniref:Cytochrome P450 n=1 Tax=Macrostomum lignano TaxID=282301 RepID=A0A1I8J363_9PLAT